MALETHRKYPRLERVFSLQQEALAVAPPSLPAAAPAAVLCLRALDASSRTNVDPRCGSKRLSDHRPPGILQFIIHSQSNTGLHGLHRGPEISANAARQRVRLFAIGVHQQKREFIAADAKSVVRCSQRFAQCGGGSLQK